MKRLPSGSLVLIAVLAAGTTRAGDVYFERDVRPILKAHCFHCHGEAGEKEGNLDVRLVRFMTAGGDSGAAIEPGNADASLLYERVHSGEMPPEEDKRLSDEELTVLRTWIEAGAPTLRPEPETVDGPLITEEERSHWSFQPIDKPAVPQVEHADRVRTPVDAFVLRQLEAADRTLADEADQRTLVRRLYYDLVGYPPRRKRSSSTSTIPNRGPGGGWSTVCSTRRTTVNGGAGTGSMSPATPTPKGTPTTTRHDRMLTSTATTSSGRSMTTSRITGS